MPYNVLSLELKNQIWLMYLRKSRQDDPNETVEEVLAKHEQILQEWAKRELGREIPEDCIYREVVSGGESIEEREEMRKTQKALEQVVAAQNARKKRSEAKSPKKEVVNDDRHDGNLGDRGKTQG